MLSKLHLKRSVAAHVLKSRTALGMTQRELASQVGASLRRIQKIEAGIEMPSLLLAVRIMICLDIDVAAMIDELTQELWPEQLTLPDNVILFPVPDDPHIRGRR